MEEGAGDGESLPHAARKFAREAIFDAARDRRVEGFEGGLLGIGHAHQFAEQQEIFHGGEVVVDADAMTQIADAALADASFRDLAFRGRERFARMRSRVVFPAPLRPRSARQEPLRTSSRRRAEPDNRRSTSRCDQPRPRAFFELSYGSVSGVAPMGLPLR